MSKRKYGAITGSKTYGRRYAKRYRTAGWKKGGGWWAKQKYFKKKRYLNQRIGGFLGIEKKYYDTSVTATEVTASWTGGELDPTANTLCAPTKGTGPSNRDGDHIVIKEVLVRGEIKFQHLADQGDSLSPRRVAVYLVWDRQTNGAQLSAEDVMTATDPEVLSFRNLQYSKRFKILKSLRCSVHQTSAFTDGANTGSLTGNSRMFNWFVRCNIPVDFKGDAGNVADIVDNSLHIIACSEGSNRPTLAYYSRVRFLG